jgi:hypothetical protein
MTLSPNEAADTLRDIAAIETRSQRVYGYHRASPFLILWGILWVVGYGLTAVWPQRGNAVWIAILAIGLAATFAIGSRGSAKVDARGIRRAAIANSRWVFPAIALIAFAFISSTFAVMGPVSGRQIGAFIPLVVAAGYALRGIWAGARFVVAGAVIATLVLGGFFLLPAYFELWMAGVGGGALILAGFWFRGV